METTIRQFQEEVRDILNQDTWFGDHGIDWLAEDTLDIEYEIKKHLGQTGIVAVVTTPELVYQGEHSSTVSQKNYEEHKPESVTFNLISNNDPSDIREVTLNTDPSTQMFEGGTIHFSKWLDGEPIDLVYNIPFPNIFGAVKDNVEQGIIPPSEGTMWRAFTGLNDEYHTDDNPFSFGIYWTIPDKQGRTITVLTSGENQVTVSGGCFGNHSMVLTIGEGSTEVVGDKTYKATVTFNGGIPQTVAMSVTKDNLSSKPFDKKLNWIEVQGNAFFNTSVVPDINDFWVSDFCPIGRHQNQNYIALCGTSNNRTANDQFGVFHGSALIGLNNRRGSYQYNCGTGLFVDSDGVSSQTTMQLDGWEHLGAFGGLQFSSTAATGSRTWRFGFQTKSPDRWNANQGTSGGNATPTYTNTTIPLAILGVYNGDESNQCYNWRGKFWLFRMWDRLRATRKLDLYPVLKDGNVCLYDAVSDTVLPNGYTGDTSTITWEEDADFNEIINDSSEVAFVETVKVVNKGFDATISLQIIENPTVNRGKPDKDAIATAIDVGHRAVYTLSGYDTEHYNDFSPSTIKQSTVAGAGGKLLQVDCRFTSTPVL